MLSRRQFEESSSSFVEYKHDLNIRNKRIVTIFDKTKYLRFDYTPASSLNSQSYDVTVGYSQVFNVPQIYFHVIDPEGSVDLNVDNVVSKFQSNIRTEGEGTMAYGVSLDVHPIDCTGCFTIHPCQTAEIMSEMTDLGEDMYLVSFWNLYSLY